MAHEIGQKPPTSGSKDCVASGQHGEVELSNIELVKLPPNTTSVIQPCDMGIIRTLKAYCRHEMRMRIIEAIDDAGADTSLTENDDIARSLNALDALHMVAEAWTKVTPTMIRNCWKKADFVLTPFEGEEDG